MQPRIVTGIAARRLHAQRLIGEPFTSPVDAVRWLAAVQSQDYSGAKWALGLRTRGVTEAELDRLFDAGAILRTHVMRPTWHFVLPEDIRWLLHLTGRRVRLSLVARYRELDLDDNVVARAGAAFAAALAGGRHLTRPELGDVLRGARIAPQGQRLPHLLMRAELDGLIVSGPRHGKQFTYALLEERVPKARLPDRTEALAELTERYFRSHGPAQVQDFAWWSGLSMADTRKGIALAGKALEYQVIEGKDYWFDAKGGPARTAAGVAHLLPNFDEYSVAYRDRSAIVPADRPLDPAFFSFGSILSNIVTVGGVVRGAWRRTFTRSSVRIEIRVLDRLGTRATAAVEAAGRRVGRFWSDRWS
ncbi:MAG TPA: winged helix DNA-binding domain-containing protein [Candidatus Dormibacteraeota bacterium]|nr:winged helix DNA-binding domain-containing protein [Candidatus Dormibacteraeota bacterium]